MKSFLGGKKLNSNKRENHGPFFLEWKARVDTIWMLWHFPQSYKSTYIQTRVLNGKMKTRHTARCMIWNFWHGGLFNILLDP